MVAVPGELFVAATVPRRGIDLEFTVPAGAVLALLGPNGAGKSTALHVIAAGSLLDFTLADHSFSMPVGRISYLHLEPMTFEEFLLACGEDPLRELLLTLAPGEEVPAALHQRLLDLLRKYLFCGGMPAAVRAFVESGSLIEVQRVQQDLLATVRDDFSKYQRRVNRDRLLKVFAALPRLGQGILAIKRIEGPDFGFNRLRSCNH